MKMRKTGLFGQILKRLLVLVFVVFSQLPASSETVYVKYKGLVDLRSFTCTKTVSSLVQRVCYNDSMRYMLLDLNGTYYHFCGVNNGIVNALLNADSKGRFFNATIKGRFNC